MKKYFICLANSKKLGGRCIAGVEIDFKREDKKYALIKDNDKVRWIRPVSHATHGEVPTSLVSDIKLGDIVEVDISAEVPEGHQCENMRYTTGSIKKVAGIKMHEKALDNMTESSMTRLFGNKGAAVHSDSINSVECSITLIKVDNISIYNKKAEYDDKKHYHMKFIYNDFEYDFTITDLEFLKNYENNNEIIKQNSLVYLTISLGVSFNDWYHKLIAGVIIL